VSDTIEALDLGEDDLLIDPWNGSGTTTQVADKLRVRSWGGDINPAMVVVAKARLLRNSVTPSDLSLCEAILQPASNHSAGKESEPLSRWFSDQSAKSLRQIERRISELLDPNAELGVPNSSTRVSSLSPLACLFYLALFRTTRQLVRPFFTKNPTWIKRRAKEEERLTATIQEIHDQFRHEIIYLREAQDTDEKTSHQIQKSLGSAKGFLAPPKDVNVHSDSEILATLTVADSTELPLKSQSAAAAVSSPPYCTRLDYAVATAPELAVLGFSANRFRVLRDSMIGTTTMIEHSPAIEFMWGPTCAQFLGEVATHPSKASSTYYLRSHLQYFDAVARSLREIDRVLLPSSRCILVVQDSYYKDVHNDLQSIYGDMADALGWALIDRHDYASTRHMGRVNVASKKYRSNPVATESILSFRTSSAESHQ